MNLTPEQKAIGKENFYAAIGSNVKGPGREPGRREFLQQRISEGLAGGDVPGYAYFGYENSVGDGGPVRVGVIGTGDEGSVLIGAVNPDYVEVRSIADIRPYNVHRAFHGDLYKATTQKVRCGLMKKYGWATEDVARQNVRVYGPYEELIKNARTDGIEAVIIALPLHLHAPAAIAAMNAGLHVLTEKLMGHSVRECKEMSLVAKQTNRHLATGHQRHYNILYAEAVDLMKRGLLGELHYIRAQWHRGNLPGDDSWQQPLPKEAKPDDPKAADLIKELAGWKGELDKAVKDKKTGDIAKWEKRIAQIEAQISDEILAKKGPDGKTAAERFGYETRVTKDYNRPAIEELIRWRLWDRTGGGLMAELGSHQLDAASIFIAAMHGGEKQYPLNVAAAANRPLFPADRDVDDHVYCLFEFPAPGYDADDPQALLKRIGVQYASINGNGFGGYGETVLGTKGTLLLDSEAEAMLFETSEVNRNIKVAWIKEKVDGKLTGREFPELTVVDPEKNQKPDAQSIAIGQMAAKDAGRGYQQEIEHWAWCVRKNPDNEDPEVHPKCNPKVALGDAVIALTTNIAARQQRRIEFKKEWFDPDDPATPENPENKEELRPDPSRYGA